MQGMCHLNTTFLLEITSLESFVSTTFTADHKLALHFMKLMLTNNLFNQMCWGLRLPPLKTSECPWSYERSEWEYL